MSNFFDQAKDLARKAEQAIEQAEGAVQQVEGFLPEEQKAKAEEFLAGAKQMEGVLESFTGNEATPAETAPPDQATPTS